MECRVHLNDDFVLNYLLIDHERVAESEVKPRILLEGLAVFLEAFQFSVTTRDGYLYESSEIELGKVRKLLEPMIGSTSRVDNLLSEVLRSR